MIITKTGFFTKLSLLALTSLSLAYSNTNCSNSSKIAILGLTAVGTYLGVMRIKSSINARLSLNDSKACYRDGVKLRQEWELNKQKNELDKQKERYQQERAGRKQDLERLIAKGEAGFFDIVRYRLALY